MQIRTSGKPTKISTAMCRKAALYFGKKLLSKRIYDNITIRLVFKDMRICAECECFIDEKRNFTIYLRKDMGTRRMLLSLAHEMVHVKQWATGEMKEYIRDMEKCKFQGKIYNAVDTHENYWLNQPWEIEARGWEMGLYKTFLKEPQYAFCRQ
ncbi:MAG: hypothetical protein ACXV2C_03915 [Candidatus Bathyarchaeia archaeon]